jgi:hypothetical protein
MQNLELTLGIHNCILALINDILENNYIRVINGLMLSDTTTQTNGVLQGNPLSPLVSNLMMADVKRTVSFRNVTLLMSSSSYPFTNLGQGGPFRSQLSYRLGVS